MIEKAAWAVGGVVAVGTTAAAAMSAALPGLPEVSSWWLQFPIVGMLAVIVFLMLKRFDAALERRDAALDRISGSVTDLNMFVAALTAALQLTSGRTAPDFQTLVRVAREAAEDAANKAKARGGA